MRKRIARQKAAQLRRSTREPARRLPRRLAGSLLALPALTALTGCDAATAGGNGPALWTAGGAAAVVLLGGTAVVVRRVTARPLEKARDLATRNLAALIDERAGLLEERAGLIAERDSHGGRVQVLTGERRILLQEREDLQRQQQDLTRQWNEAAAVHGETAQRLEQLLSDCELLVAERDGLAKERDELQGSVDATFVNLAMRTLTLVERQLVLIEALEGREADAAQLESLFRLDHLATRMRRNSENMLLLAGLENSHRSRKTVTLLDVVRAAVSEIERYERVKLDFLAAVRLSGAVADDTSHLLAELLENATAFSPPQDQVEVGGWLLDNGEVMISVTDRGIGLPAERLRALNEQLAEALPTGAQRRDALLAGALTGRSMGLFVVARLARRHDIRVQLRENAQGGGVTAMVVLPREALHQDGLSTTDLDDQRRAERSAAASADQARAAAEQAASVALAPRHGDGLGALAGAGTGVATGTGPVAGAGTGVGGPADAELPALPRRRPGGGAGAIGGAGASGPVPAAPVEPAVAAAVAPEQAELPPSPAPSPAPAPAVAPPSPAGSPEQPAEPSEGAAFTALGLPRRVPSGNGLPGTGETPASGLRRVAVEAETGRPEPAAPAVPAAPVAGEPEPPAVSPRSRTSAEELRRRLGGFQSGLRQAARETAAEGQDR